MGSLEGRCLYGKGVYDSGTLFGVDEVMDLRAAQSDAVATAGIHAILAHLGGCREGRLHRNIHEAGYYLTLSSIIE